uniref:Transmembrane protein n=1 Tax=Panagrolaimus davidi TaxID=227884 RepID=A0A914QKP4_9BILA
MGNVVASVDDLSYGQLQKICKEKCGDILHTSVHEQIVNIRETHSNTSHVLWTLVLCILFYFLGLFTGHILTCCNYGWKRLTGNQPMPS